MFSWMCLSTSSSECFSYIFGVKSMEYKLCFWSTLIGCFKCSFKSNDIDPECIFLTPPSPSLRLKEYSKRMGRQSLENGEEEL